MNESCSLFELNDEEDGILKEEFLKLLHYRERGNDDSLSIAMRIERIDPNSFYCYLGLAVAKSWHVSIPFIKKDRIEVRKLIEKAEILSVSNPTKKALLIRAMGIIRQNFKRNNVPYEY